MSKRIAIPILFVSVKLNLVRGRKWSLVEHAILAFVSKQESSSLAIAAKANLPNRLVIESLIRLMRVGWIEMAETMTGVMFRATARGKDVG